MSTSLNITRAEIIAAYVDPEGEIAYHNDEI